MLTPAVADPSSGTRVKDPDATRALILECAFQEIHQHGYGGTSLDRILSQTDLTKGALYHHFGSKAELGLAVIDEVIRGWITNSWLDPLEESNDPATTLIETLRRNIGGMPEQQIACGCPLNNLTQEMANSDDRVRARLLQLFDLWRKGIASSLERGQSFGTVRADIDPEATATFIVSAIEGLAGTAKSTRDHSLVLAVMAVLVQFLETLRPVTTGRAKPQAASRRRR